MTAALLAGASIWLVLVDPLVVADTVGEHGCHAVLAEAAKLIVGLLEQVVRWL